MMLQNIFYDLPSAVYLLLAVLAFMWLFWSLYQYRQQLLKPFMGKKALLVPRRGVAYWTQSILFCLVWILGVLALMQPKGNERYPSAPLAKKMPADKVKRRIHDVIFLVDASASMSVKDTRSGITRLDYAKDIGDEIMRRLRGENGSLHVFTSDPMQLSPSTLDYLFLRLMLREVQINEGETSGTNIRQALSSIRQQYFAKPSPRLKTLILLTDGGDTHLESLTGSGREQAAASIIDLIKDSEENHLRVFTVGLGSKGGQAIPGITYQSQPVISAVEGDLLKQLSEKGRGRYYLANDYSPMQIAADIIAKMTQDTPFYEEEMERLPKSQASLIYDYYFQVPLGLAMMCLMLAILIPQASREFLNEK